MYSLVLMHSRREIGRVKSPSFVKEDEVTKEITECDETEAQGLIYDGILYTIMGRRGFAYETLCVELIPLDTEDTLYHLLSNEERSSAYIDYLSAMTGIDLPDEEEEELEEE